MFSGRQQQMGVPSFLTSLYTIGRSVEGYLLSCLCLNHEAKVDSLPSPPLPESPPLTVLSAREPLTPAHLHRRFWVSEQ